MNITDAIKDSRSKRLHIAAIAVTTIATVLVSLYCLFSGTFIVFQNLFYVPIVLSCMYYTMRGFIYSVCLAALYMALILFFTLESGVIMQASIRVALFIVIAGIVTFLSIRRKQAERILQEAEETFRRLFEDSTDPILLLNGETFVDCNPAGVAILGCASKYEVIKNTPGNYLLNFSRMEDRPLKRQRRYWTSRSVTGIIGSSGSTSGQTVLNSR